MVDAQAEWFPDRGPARPRHIREAEAAKAALDAQNAEPESGGRGEWLRGAARAAGRAAPYVGAAGWLGVATSGTGDDDGSWDLFDWVDFGWGDFGDA